MGGIWIDEEKILAGQIALVGKLVIDCALDITAEMFEHFPVLRSRIGIEACQIGNRVGDVKSSHHCKVLERTNCTEVGNLRHEVFVFLGAGSHGM